MWYATESQERALEHDAAGTLNEAPPSASGDDTAPPSPKSERLSTMLQVLQLEPLEAPPSASGGVAASV